MGVHGKIVKLLTDDGYLKLLPAATYDTIDRRELRIWCHINARYGLPTVELVDWLRTEIGSARAIEIGSGAGDLCHHLGIPGTDNKQQTWPDVAAYYDLMRQPTIEYPAAVEELGALAAIEKHNPHTVVASWVTHWIDPDLPMPPNGGNMYGVKEDLIIAKGIRYIMIGNEDIHQHKPIMALPHKTISLPFIRSRSAYPELDRAYIWNP